MQPHADGRDEEAQSQYALAGTGQRHAVLGTACQQRLPLVVEVGAAHSCDASSEARCGTGDGRWLAAGHLLTVVQYLYVSDTQDSPIEVRDEGDGE
ncbi:hypothetical protein ADK65_25115 [Streptomyces sp. NRRL B-1140]|nr:hypothetical protein ADK65_25115 [Streptomyces sp. NRRL B-1140]